MNSYDEQEMLALSGVQHFLFCRRQWALIHVEQQWAENVLTVEGDLMHARCHDEAIRERRGDVLVVLGLAVRSHALCLNAGCDVVEFHASEEGHPLAGESGLWRAYPVEYKHGRKKRGAEDRAQLCAQAMCLEEMFACDIPEGALFYGQTRSRETVTIDAAWLARRGQRCTRLTLGATPLRSYKRRGSSRARFMTSACPRWPSRLWPTTLRAQWGRGAHETPAQHLVCVH